MLWSFGVRSLQCTHFHFFHFQGIRGIRALIKTCKEAVCTHDGIRPTMAQKSARGGKADRDLSSQTLMGKARKAVSMQPCIPSQNLKTDTIACNENAPHAFNARVPQQQQSTGECKSNRSLPSTCINKRHVL